MADIIQQICQWLTVAWLAVIFFTGAHRCFHGDKESKASGFKGFVGVCVCIVLLSAMMYGAGAFSVLL